MSVALKVGVKPDIGFPEISLSEILIVAAAIPFAIVGPEERIVDVDALAGPEIKVTFPPVEAEGRMTFNVFDSALMDFKVQKESPLASEEEQAPYVFKVPVAEKVGVSPE